MWSTPTSLYKVATAKLNVRVHFTLQILCPSDNVSADPNSSLAVISFTSCNFYKCPLNVCKQQPSSNGTEKQRRKHRFVFQQNYCCWTTFPQFLSHLDIQNLILSTRVLGRFTHCTEEGWRWQDISSAVKSFVDQWIYWIIQQVTVLTTDLAPDCLASSMLT